MYSDLNSFKYKNNDPIFLTHDYQNKTQSLNFSSLLHELSRKSWIVLLTTFLL